MTITEFINDLQEMKERFGDLEVYMGAASSVFGAVQAAKYPYVKELAVLDKRERMPRYVTTYNSHQDAPSVRSGKKIVYIGR